MSPEYFFSAMTLVCRTETLIHWGIVIGEHRTVYQSAFPCRRAEHRDDAFDLDRVDQLGFAFFFIAKEVFWVKD